LNVCPPPDGFPDIGIELEVQLMEVLMDFKSPLLGRRYVAFVVCSILTLGFFAVINVELGMAQAQVFPNTRDVQSTTHTLRAKAKPDECWAYLASPPPLPMWTDPNNCAQYATNPPAKPKVNQAYIWGIAEAADSIWYGTVANPQCITSAGVAPASGNPNGAPTAYATTSWVCEYYDSPYYPALYPDARIGDARTSRVYRYNKSNQELTDLTPKNPAWFNATKNPEALFPLLIQLRGIRAATVFNNVVILAGPNLNPTKGIAFFGWNATTGEFLGGYSVLGYNNIRQFLNLNGILYAGVGTNDALGKITGGAILRVNPSVVPGCVLNPTLPFPCFLMNGGANSAPTPPTIVGNLNEVSGTLTAHNGRIFTATWASSDIPGSMAHLYMSPAVPAGGLTTANASQWTTLWKASDYEPDPAMANTYAGGAIASFDGYLWWGTLHIPVAPMMALIQRYPPTSPQQALADLTGTFRTGAFFRIKDPETNPKIDLVYGNYKLPVYTPPTEGHPGGTWTLKVNNTGKRSLWGPSGFGNLWNIYIWSAAVWDNRLWIGTMDYGFSSKQGSAMIAQMSGGTLPPHMYNKASFGGDLYYFTSATQPAFAESTNGVDNPTSYGIRNQLSSSNGNLFLGVANAESLLTDPADPLNFGGLGGWELKELSRLTTLNTPAGTNVSVSLPTGVSVQFCSVTKPGSTFSSSVANTLTTTERFHPLLEPYNLNGPAVPDGIAGSPTSLTLLWSTAVWDKSCSSAVSVPIPAGITKPRLLQLSWDGNEYVWKDITASVNSAAGRITGTPTAEFNGILGVAQAAVLAPLKVEVAGKGVDQAKGYYVDLTVTNVSGGVAKNVTIDTLTFQTFSGAGTVTHNPDVAAAALPRVLGEIPHEGNKAVRLYLKSTTSFGGSGVSSFTISESIRMSDVSGATPVVTATQAVAVIDNPAPQPLPAPPPPPVTAVWLTAPTHGATVSGSAVTVSASASSDVVGVQFQLNGTNLGPEDKTIPYSVTLNTTMVANGTHKLTAVARSMAGNLANGPVISITVNNPVPTTTYSLSADGGISYSTTTEKNSSTIAVTHARIEQAPTTLVTVSAATAETANPAGRPAGVAIIGLRKNDVLVSEAGVPASPEIFAGRIYAENGGAVSTGIALSNTSTKDAQITFYFTDQNGRDSAPGSYTLKANQQIAALLNDAPFNAPSNLQGTFTFQSSGAVAATGIRGMVNERGEFLMSMLPVVAVGSGDGTRGTLLPHFADGGGWTTQVVLVNPSTSSQSGTIRFFGQGSKTERAQLLEMTVNGVSASAFEYSLPAHGMARFVTAGLNATTEVGSVQITPASTFPGSDAVPAAFATLSFRDNGITVSETTIAALPAGTTFRMYSEISGGPGRNGSLQSGFVIANPANEPVTVSLQLTKLDGNSLGITPVTLTIPAGGQLSKFLHEVFSELPSNFQGVVKVTAASQISIAGLRGRYNERGDFLISATPPSNEALNNAAALVFPHIASGQGYTTQLILLGHAGRLFMFGQDGALQTSSSLAAR
jgi:hypothetical protein